MRRSLFFALSLIVGCSGGDFQVGEGTDASVDDTDQSDTSVPIDSSTPDEGIDTTIVDSNMPDAPGPDTSIGPDTSLMPDTIVVADTAIDTFVMPDTAPPPDTSPLPDTFMPDMGMDAPPTCGPTVKPDDAIAVYVAPTGSDSGDGSRVAPLATLQAAVKRAHDTGKSKVNVAPGTYTGSFTIPDSTPGITIEGGYLLTGSSWFRSCDADARSLVTIVGDAPIAITFDTIHHPSGLRRLTVKSKATTTPVPAASGESRVATFVKNSDTTVTIDDVVLYAFDAVSGGAVTGTGPSTIAPCSSTCGTGAAGAPGSNGMPATLPGSFSPAGYTPADGSPGGPGGAGAMGTAPGAPETRSDCVTSCMNDETMCAGTAGLCSVSTSPITAGTGTCGCPGGGGGGGLPGKGGGASIGLLAVGGSGKVDVKTSLLHSSNGGSGSPGSAGADGTAGTAGTAGTDKFCNTKCSYTTGCNCMLKDCCAASGLVKVSGGSIGGTGGTGGKGGTGGGGAGGSSFAYVAIGATVTTSSDTILQHGSGGSGAGGAPVGGSSDHLP